MRSPASACRSTARRTSSSPAARSADSRPACGNGISIEHGHDNPIWLNSIQDCGTGVHLWTDEDADLAKSAFGRGRDTTSRKNHIVNGNGFYRNEVDILLADDRDSEVGGNAWTGKLKVERRGDTSGAKVETGMTIGPIPPPAVPDVALLPGRHLPPAPTNLAPDKWTIQVDDWGPIAPGETRLFPAQVSDDGLRVWLDGSLVVDDWTWHGPTPHDVTADLAAGKHTLRVEHFEIDGWAALRVVLTRR